MATRAKRAAALLAVLGLAATAAHAGKTRDYRKELREAESQQRRKRYRESLALCEKMLEHFREAWQVKEVTQLKIEGLILDSQYDAALAALAALAKAYGDDAKLQTATAVRTGDVLRLRKKLDQAVATYRKAANACAKTQPDKAADALGRAADVLCRDLDRPADAVALYREIETKFGELLPKRGAEAVRAVAAVHERQTKDMAAAAAAYRTLADKYASVYDERALSGFYRKAVECFLKADKAAEAIATARKAEAALTTPAEKVQFALRQADALMADKKLAEAREQYERLVCAYPLEQRACQQAQGKIVETYRAESRWDEALGAARTLYDAAGSEQDIRGAAQVVARAFLAVDGNLRRANEFLVYQRHGPAGADGKANTADDVRVNHLAKVAYPKRAATTDRRFQAAVSAQPNTYEGHRTKGFLYVYWGKSKEAAGEFRRAFQAAEMSRVPAAAQELVLVGMKAYTASFHDLARVFEYISYGPKGKSGKENIPDPFAHLP